MRTILLSLIGLFGAPAICAQDYPVLTYNIRYANGHDDKDRWDLRKEALANTVLEQRPALIGLQEVLREQLAFLKGKWPSYESFGVGRDDGFEGGEFAPVLFDTTRFRLIEGRTVWLSPTPDSPGKGWDATCNRIVSLVVLSDRSTGDSLWVANTHWDAEGRTARSESARMICELLSGPIARGKRTIFMGDLNAKSCERPVKYLREYMTDACPKGQRGRGTFNGFRRLRLLSKRIDYVWLAPERWNVERYDVLHPKVAGRQVSDHFPVIVSLRPR